MDSPQIRYSKYSQEPALPDSQEFNRFLRTLSKDGRASFLVRWCGALARWKRNPETVQQIQLHNAGRPRIRFPGKPAA